MHTDLSGSGQGKKLPAMLFLWRGASALSRHVMTRCEHVDLNRFNTAFESMKRLCAKRSKADWQISKPDANRLGGG